MSVRITRDYAYVDRAALVQVEALEDRAEVVVVADAEVLARHGFFLRDAAAGDRVLPLV